MFQNRGLDMLLTTVVGGGLIAVIPLVVIVLYWLHRKRPRRKIPQTPDGPP
jgi:hypothetical protein